jgi:hypothetical protein
MIDLKHPVNFLIVGVTLTGRTFRPSDWADRLAGIMSGFRPPGSGPATHLGYSPWVQPVLIEGERGVSVDAALASHEAMAYAFLVNFARDNDLQVRVPGKL